MRLMIFFILMACQQSSPDSLTANPPAHEARGLLFIGNSLTYTHDIPSIVKKIAATVGIIYITRCECRPNYALFDHWSESKYRSILKSGQYHTIIMQQGPSSQAWGRSVLIDYAKRFADLGRAYGMNSAMYMVWPDQAYDHTFPGVIQNYADAADSAQAITLPVGFIWREYMKETRDESVYGGDRFHPSKKGSFLAAFTIFSYLNPEVDISTFGAVPFFEYVNVSEFNAIRDLIITHRNRYIREPR